MERGNGKVLSVNGRITEVCIMPCFLEQHDAREARTLNPVICSRLDGDVNSDRRPIAANICTLIHVRQ